MDKQIFQKFVDAINEHNVDRICSFMTDDHTFIDSHGNEVVGKEKMRAGWIGYFQWFPDYKIEIRNMFLDRDTVAAFGFASGTFQGLSDKKANHWRLPASWKAVIKNLQGSILQETLFTFAPMTVQGMFLQVISTTSQIRISGQQLRLDYSWE